MPPPPLKKNTDDDVVPVDLTEIIERFWSTSSWRRNRTNVASEARPRFSTLSWYVNHVTSGLATVSRRGRFFLTLVILWLGVTHTFSIWAHGDGKRTLFFCLEEGAKPHPGYLGFTSSQSSAKCCKTKTQRSARWQITYVFWHVITYCKTSLISLPLVIFGTSGNITDSNFNWACFRFCEQGQVSRKIGPLLHQSYIV